MGQPWVTANLEGLANTLSNFERSRIVGELFQNSMDTAAKCITGSLSKPKYGYAEICVEDDDPVGFESLKLAHEMFADTSKRNDPTKAGRFTIGEKRFLSLCRSAQISSTTGTEIFEKENGKENRRFSSKKREIGTRVDGSVEMTDEQFKETCNNILKLIPHENVTIVFNGKEIPHRKPVFSFKATLKTEVANATTRKMMKVDRKTTINLYEPLPGEKASLYELGIPVVETGDKWHVNIMQRVPLNSDRDNVTPSYLETIRALVANNAHNLLTEQDVGTTWIREATSSDKIDKEAYSDIMTKVFGEKKVIADPTDPESTKSAHANGFNPLYGRTLTAGEHENNRRFAAIPTSSSLFPTPKPYSNDPNAEPAEMIPEAEWTKGMEGINEYTKKLSVWLLNTDRIRVCFMKHFNGLACFSGNSESGCGIDFNVGSLGKDFFANGITEEVDELILHEFAHYYCSDHLDERYYHALSRLGAKLKRLAVEEAVQLAESHKMGITIG